MQQLQVIHTIKNLQMCMYSNFWAQLPAIMEISKPLANMYIATITAHPSYESIPIAR